MAAWRNGYIPESDLIIFERGWNATDGDWYHGLTPATYARHLALVRRAERRTGRTLAISDGFGAYRPMASQVVARRIYGNGAAVPGTSSHGGFWEGRETLAMDYGNWNYVYLGFGGRAAFYEDQRAVGLWPGMIEPSRGYPDEPWHAVDPNPNSAVPAFDDAVPFPEQPKEDDAMSVQIRDKDTGLIAQVAPGYFAAMTNMGSANVMRNVFSAQDERHELTTGEFLAVTDSCGIPREEVKAGNYWSVNNAALATIRHIEQVVDKFNA